MIQKDEIFLLPLVSIYHLRLYDPPKHIHQPQTHCQNPFPKRIQRPHYLQQHHGQWHFPRIFCAVWYSKAVFAFLCVWSPGTFFTRACPFKANGILVSCYLVDALVGGSETDAGRTLLYLHLERACCAEPMGRMPRRWHLQNHTRSRLSRSMHQHIAPLPRHHTTEKNTIQQQKHTIPWPLLAARIHFLVPLFIRKS